MSREKKRKTTATSAQRNEFVRRHIVDGTPAAALAHEINVTLQVIHGWIDLWRRRAGHWYGKPLEPWAAELGFEIVGNSRGRTTIRHEDAALLPSDDEAKRALMAFTDRLGRLPTQNRYVLESYAALTEGDRAKLAPALDVYLEACDAMDQVRELVQRASAIASAEVLDGGLSQRM